MKIMELSDRVGEGLENFTIVGVSFVLPQIPSGIAFGEFQDFLTISIQVLTMLYLFIKIVGRGDNQSERDSTDS
jgi:hypothetical protein